MDDVNFILICGGRDYDDSNTVNETLRKVLANYEPEKVVIVTGGAIGADTLAMQWAIKNEIKYLTVPPRWSVNGRAAAFLRNEEMASILPQGTLVVAFPGGKGTAHMISMANTRGFEVLQVSS